MPKILSTQSAVKRQGKNIRIRDKKKRVWMNAWRKNIKEIYHMRDRETKWYTKIKKKLQKNILRMNRVRSRFFRFARNWKNSKAWVDVMNEIVWRRFVQTCGWWVVLEMILSCDTTHTTIFFFFLIHKTVSFFFLVFFFAISFQLSRLFVYSFSLAIRLFTIAYSRHSNQFVVRFSDSFLLFRHLHALLLTQHCSVISVQFRYSKIRDKRWWTQTTMIIFTFLLFQFYSAF